MRQSLGTPCSAIVIFCLILMGCSKRNQESDDSRLSLAKLTSEESTMDFNELVGKMRALYAPLEYKESKFEFTFQQTVEKYREEIELASSDAEVFGTFYKFLRTFRDGHLSLAFTETSEGILRWSISIFVMPVDGAYVIAGLPTDGTIRELSIGDELLEVDGQTPDELLSLIKQYESLGNELSDRNLIYAVFNRPAYMTEMTPTKATARIKVKKLDGSIIEVEHPWHKQLFFDHKPYLSAPANGVITSHIAVEAHLNEAAKGSRYEVGSKLPFFLNKTLVDTFNLKKVTLEPTIQKEYQLAAAQFSDVFAATFEHRGRNLLIVRQPTYSHDSEYEYQKHLNIYRAIFHQMESKVDGMIIDQMHNPGGDVRYMTDFFRLFIIAETSPNIVFSLNPDRSWISSLRQMARRIDPTLMNDSARSAEELAEVVDRAQQSRQTLSPPVPLYRDRWLKPDEKRVWKKPVVVLIDDLSGSSGDAFPLLMKSSGRAKIIGNRSMGLGGTVENVGNLSVTGASLSLTRGLFSIYQKDPLLPENFIENNGVLPDLERLIRLHDFRSNYVDFFRDVSCFLVDDIEDQTAPLSMDINAP